MEISASTCLECGKSFRGRIDKKFCDDNCRNTYNNKLNAPANALVRSINSILKRNRRVMEELVPTTDDKVKTTREKMLAKGFLFKYTTHTYTNKQGNIYYFCYEYGYLPLDNDWVLIVKRKEQEV